jgi:hypothetical protein
MSHNSHEAASHRTDNPELRKIDDPRDPPPVDTVSDPPTGTQLVPPPPSRGDGDDQ